MKIMKKINLKGVSEVLSEKELKNVMRGSTTSCTGCASGEWYTKNGKATRCSFGGPSSSAAVSNR
jgi:hypothetical protein